jgi:2-methylisocitrate lyase-like PEP mutase family enzyme
MIAGLREIHAAARPLVSPLAHDALSARLIEAAGFKAFNIGGSSLLAARHALPDIGLAALGEMAAAIRDTIEPVRIPCLVDGDDGYGDVKAVTRTVQVLESVGVAGVILEDQSRENKKPGADAAQSVVPLDVILQKLRAAQAARADDRLVIIGRTDALGSDGLDEALRRGEAMLKAGADGIFVAGLKTPGQFQKVGGAFKGQWNAAAIFEGRGTPVISPRQLYEMGFSQVVLPNSLILRVVKTIEYTLEQIKAFAEARDTSIGTTGAAEISLAGFQQAVMMDQWNKIGSAGDDDTKAG